MRNDVEDRLKALSCTRGRARKVHDERAAPYAGDSSGQSAQRIHGTHGFSKTGSPTIKDNLGSLGSEVARPESGASRGDHESNETVAHLHESFTDTLPTIGNHPNRINHESCSLERCHHRLASPIGGVTSSDRVRHDHDASRPRHGVTPSVSPGRGRRPLAHWAASSGLRPSGITSRSSRQPSRAPTTTPASTRISPSPR